jgi:hypothetical protein
MAKWTTQMLMMRSIMRNNGQVDNKNVNDKVDNGNNN